MEFEQLHHFWDARHAIIEPCADRHFDIWATMVTSDPGVLVSCDIPIKEFLLWLDEQQDGTGMRFIIADLDDVHLFVKQDAVEFIQTELNKLYEENQYSFIK